MSELMVCGTGGWGGPKPGDPDNYIILTATAAFGGIDVAWTYPGVNPQAVAHTILFRGTSPEFGNATRHAIVSGSLFYDKTTSASAIQYYYWIQIVSINGTYGAVIGPATATARPAISELIEQLTARIDAGMLAQSLKQEIDQITLNKLGITAEMLARDEADEALGVAFNEVQAHSEGTRALLQEEVLARTSANEAFVSTVNTLHAQLTDGLSTVTAAVQSESLARVAANEALAKQINTVQVNTDDALASVQQSMTTEFKKTADGLTKVSALYTAKVQANGLIGGFGVYASDDGVVKEVQAGFDVDTFWIGRTGIATKKKPFIVSGGEVFMDDAVINKLTFSKLRADDGSFLVQNGKVQAKYLQVTDLASSNYVPKFRGWSLKQDGTFEMNGNTVGSGRMEQTNQAIKVYDGSGVLRVQLGNLLV